MRVSDIMTPDLISVTEDAPLIDALRTLLERKVGALAVVDAKGATVGVLSEDDLLRRAELGTQKHHPAWLEFVLGGGRTAQDYCHSHGRRVGELMTRGAITIDADAQVSEAVDAMTSRHIRRLIVTRGDKAVGVLARSDLLKALLAVMPAPSGPRTDAEILADIGSAFEREPWAPRGGVRATVESGVVTLEGAITDERVRPALKILIENVAGVRQIKDHVAWVEPNSGFLVPNTEGED